ncbi:MAG: hypothetical protein LBS83_02335 [Holosporales bacterium]|jgi:hypothetical protein|nr:hypothetical protein [Holosporales bacterium]
MSNKNTLKLFLLGATTIVALSNQSFGSKVNQRTSQHSHLYTSQSQVDVSAQPTPHSAFASGTATSTTASGAATSNLPAADGVKSGAGGNGDGGNSKVVAQTSSQNVAQAPAQDDSGNSGNTKSWSWKSIVGIVGGALGVSTLACVLSNTTNLGQNILVKVAGYPVQKFYDFVSCSYKKFSGVKPELPAVADVAAAVADVAADAPAVADVAADAPKGFFAKKK